VAIEVQSPTSFFLVLYALATLEWLFVKDFIQYFTLRINEYQRVPGLRFGQHVEFWATKAIHFVLFLSLPLMMMPVWNVITGLVVYHLVFSTALTFIFQIAHQVEKVSFPEPVGDPPMIVEEWGAHQMRTTANFATTNRFMNWFAGGLNFQIEHHLFPRMRHTLYPRISLIVRQTALEFGLPYHHYDTYAEAVKSHYRFLREMSREPQGVLVPSDADTHPISGSHPHGDNDLGRARSGPELLPNIATAELQAGTD
jgi:linoleoyl-CoA desaturase